MDCSSDESCINKDEALRLKIAGIAAILVSSLLGVAIPLVFKSFNRTRVFFAGQCFAAGVILSTGFVHILPDAFAALTNPCLSEHPWEKFPFPGFIAMTTSMLVLFVDSMALGYYTRREGETSSMGDHADHPHHVHAHPSNDHSAEVSKVHDSQELEASAGSTTTTIKNKVVAQVLEFGILAHSVIIGIAMGTSNSPCTVRPLVGALVFHQFFEGLALGGCISLGSFKAVSKLLMALFFTITTPGGIGIGMIISSRYNENDPKALIVEGVFDSMSAGILIYMALVDLLASHFMSKEFLQQSWRHYSLGYLFLVLGAGAMSVIAIWA
ncbi:hypothetical protein SELMODRAFT_91749 [Selaginella moellendorffii]|uniref:ZIP family transporter n=1 Tax=Selaginella moellendorffii TaxID=88036 RepID=D8RE03_SELML|nr:zinc transporter 1 [Selaginella moellendorffii]EFJ29347.1 hypothetical protein SELMODRAFT_91749 [Selaginella moellendorffii]|eukprot:XP_002969259.1 zinc transporter 1 [Selaginella moellendorffii]